MRFIRTLVPLLLVSAACQAPPSRVEAAAAQRSFEAPVALCELDDPQVAESSGIAASRRADGVWYTHNDSGDRPRFFRFDEKGHVDAVFTLKGAAAIDWEDMASATVAGKDYLYFADIGDNFEFRATIAVYRTEEPSGEGRVLAEVDRYLFKYPDGRHDAEAFFVRPETGDFYFVTKSANRASGVYKASAPGPGQTATLEKVGEVKLGGGLDASRQITGGDVSPGGEHVLLRTYLGAYEFAAGKGSEFDRWVKAAPRSIEVRAEMQGEAIAYTSSSGGFATTSEGAPCRVSLVKIRP